MNNNNISKRFWKRKIAHFAAILLVILYLLVNYYFGRGLALFSLLVILIIFLFLDYLRLDLKIKVPIVNQCLKPREQNVMVSSIFFVAAIIICFALFDIRIAIAAILMTIFGDPISAFFGHKEIGGKINGLYNKSWGGAIAAVIICTVIGYLVLPNLLIVIPMAIASTFVEIITSKVDDNFVCPLVAGLLGQILLMVL